MKLDDNNELAIPSVSTKQLINMLKQDMLANFYTENPTTPLQKARNAKIEDVFLKEFNKPFFSYKVEPHHAAGRPGVGKTTSFMVAGEWAAKQLDLNFVPNPVGDFRATENDFVIVTLELSGETSKTVVSGVPVVVEMSGEKYTMSAPPLAFDNLKNAGGSMLLLDDMPNALPGIQNMCLSLMERKGFQNISIGENTFVGSTGNLGKLDGTNISSTSSANASRRQNWMVYDTPEDWCHRAATSKGAAHQRGDAYLGEFFQQNPELFSTITKSKNGEPFATPRTWSKFLGYSRVAFAQYEKMLDIGDSKSKVHFDLPEIMLRAQSLVGMDAANKLKGYYLTITNNVMPIAKKLISGDDLNNIQKALIKEHAGKVGNESELFFSQLNRTLGEFAALEVSKNVGKYPNDWVAKSKPVLDLYTKAIVDNILKLNRADKIGSSFVAFSNKLCTLHNSEEVAQYSKVTNAPKLKPDLALELIKSFAQHPETHQKMGDKPIWKVCGSDVVTNVANYESSDSKVANIQSQLESTELADLLKSKATTKQEAPEPPKEALEPSPPSMVMY
ncbi:hypothetical protein GCM10011607_28390 [Shewanella inventionis]|uniref:Uncharacterized protein n=1 Tax=Shewanella inventionis TaxID=1738770 RepID=A0ABQ1JD94_9GAMM|nr:hypothetical protein [Shewanella inventionis]GGB66009.1 hypothetical protein GCM10011607_28390 [Shewanella inventionis]